MPEVNEKQIGGDHYQSEYQHWDFVAELLGGRYLEGCITKYVSRWRKKNGVQDLEKAQHYLEKLIDSLDRYPPRNVDISVVPRLKLFCSANDLDKYERAIIITMATWAGKEDLEVAYRVITKMIDKYREKMKKRLAQ
jgi:hypothetical protein